MRPGAKLLLAAIVALVLIVGARNLGGPTPAVSNAAVPAAAQTVQEQTGGESAPDSGSGYEVELIRPDGSVVDVVLDGSFNVVKVVR